MRYINKGSKSKESLIPGELEHESLYKPSRK